MPQETTHPGASGLPAETPKQKSFPDPSQYAHQEVDKHDKNGDHTPEKPMSERDKIMQDIESRIDQERSAAIAAQMKEYSESAGKTPEQLEEETRQAEEREALEKEGLQSREAIDAEKRQVSRRDELPPEYADDPLADYIVMDEENNTPMFVTKIDGEERYIPLEQARRQIQKQEAADSRLRQAAERQKALDAREAEITRQEAELAARLQKKQDTSPPEPTPDVSDQDLLTEAQQFVENMFNNSPDEATASLAQLLGNMRHLQTKPTAQVDPQELARTTAALVREQQRLESQQQDAAEGLEKFKTDYPEIMANRALFLYADDMTDSIAEEWRIEGRSFTDAQVMHEAGKRTMEWIESQRGPKSTPPSDPNNDRHERKRTLRPMPRARSQALQQESGEDEPQSPTDIVAEMRKARGQG